MIGLIIYDKDTGKLLRQTMGDVEGIMYDLKPNEDFTMVMPENYRQTWYWNEDKWQLEPIKQE